MKKLLLLLLFIPLVSFGQNNNLKSNYPTEKGTGGGMQGTVWEVSFRNEPPRMIYIVGIGRDPRTMDDTNKFIILSKRLGKFWEDYVTNKTWSQDGNEIVFSSSERILSGTISDDGKVITGIGINPKNASKWEWKAWRIDKDWIYDK